MRKILIIGGRLQGIEIAYLAKKAEYFTIILDKDKDCPASCLADRFVHENVLLKENVIKFFVEVDVVISALENKEVLYKIQEYAKITNTKVIFDEVGYNISSSKILSNQLFDELQLPSPNKYPNCNYPLIIKPDNLSGSSNVHKVFSEKEAEHIIANLEGEMVIQEYLDGRSFSLEVIGDGENFYFPQITEVIVDENFDCKRIIAPAKISNEIEEQFYLIAKKLAERLKIKGIFDIEVICHNNKLKLLEIDARFPSQTPISVYNSTGINMVEMLVELAFNKFDCMKPTYNKVCYYQQIAVNNSSIKVLGEHIIERCKKLQLIEGFFGADEGITDYIEGSDNWKAIIIVIADSHQNAYEKFTKCVENIKNKMNNQEILFVEG